MPYVSTFRAPSEYELEMERARRQQALAEALAQQAYQPLEGGAAPIPSAAPLVRALQSFMAGRAERKARESLERAKEMETQTGQQIAGRLMGTTAKPTIDDLTEVTPAGRIGPAVPSDLTEVQLESQYRYDPEGAMQKAMTPQGMAAVRGNPMLAAALQRSMEAPAAEEFYAPTETEEGLVQFGKRGSHRVTGLKAPAKTPTQTNLAKLIAERDALPPGDPRLAVYNEAIKGETQGRGTTIQMPPTARDLQQDESRLRDQLQSRLKEMDWSGTQSAMQRIVTAPNTPIGDVDIVYAVAKAADSSGAVRKEDFDLRAKEGSYGGQIKSWYEEAKSGRMLRERRQQLIDSAMQFYQAREASVNKLLSDYTGIAQRSGLNVENVVGPFKPTPLWSANDEKRLNELRKKAAGGAK